MRYVLTEEQYTTFVNYLNQVFDTMFNLDQIMFGPNQDFYDQLGDEEFDEEKWDYYRVIKSQKDVIFTWYDFEEPLVQIYNGVGAQLDEEFGNKWQIIFMEWFEDSFGKPVKKLKY